MRRAMKVLHGVEEARAAVRQLHQRGRSVGLVPTMGALHEGHFSLIRAARARCQAVAVTIFVNPLQFGPQEDLDAYPRPLAEDLAACAREGVDLVFAPDNETMFPSDVLTTVHVSGLTDALCGPCRPGHFDGVATVVAKLFSILPADVAFFGEKDFQQLAVIRRMVLDLSMAIEIVGCPTVREADGLARSSRNAYLSADQREQARSLSEALFNARERVTNGARDVAELKEEIRSTIQQAGPAKIEYVDVVDVTSLELLSVVDRPARICLAVRIGTCRLIDNIGVDPPPVSG